jgi:hypothetical protein
MGALDLPFDLNKLMSLQFETLKHAIEWLAMQNKKLNLKIKDLENMSRPSTPAQAQASSPTAPPAEILKFDSKNGIDPSTLNQAISQVMG